MKGDGFRRRHGGFTLVEMALVLGILGLLLRTALVPFATLRAERAYQTLELQLADIKRNLLGHLLTHGALPCPGEGGTAAATGSSGAPIATRPMAASEACTSFHGTLPMQSGIYGQSDAQGALLDPWGRPYRYAVAQGDAGNAEGATLWTTPALPAEVGIDALGADLVICRDETVSGDCRGGNRRADEIVFVVASAGADGIIGFDDDADGRHWLDLPRGQYPGGSYDDLSIWLSREEAVYWLLESGWLP